MFLSRLFLVFFCAFFASSNHSFAQAPSGEKWFTIKTANFHVHHTAALENYARALTYAFERALPLLENDLKWRAPTPIDIVVMDPSDSANGLAMNFPNTHIELFSVPFETDSALGHYVNWVDELATHELTHIVANDTVRGAYTFLHRIFGSWVKPNGLQPSWLMEGLAVYEETSLSTGGRGRSPLFEAMLKTAASENKLNSPDYISLDRFNDGVPWWPGGNTAYLLGYAIQAGAHQKNKHVPGEISFANGAHIPFMPNSVSEEVSGKDWFSSWEQTANKIQSRYAPLAKSEVCRLTTSGRFTGGHALSSDGWVYFSEENKEEGYYLSRIRVDAPCGNNQVERLFQRRFECPTQVAVSPDGSRVAFIEMEILQSEKLIGELYVWHRDSKKVEKLTVFGRAKDPAFHNNNILYIKNLGDLKSGIVSLDPSNKNEKILFTSAPMERLSGLYANADKIIFSLHNNNGVEKIYSLSPEGKATPLTSDKTKIQYERNPSFGANGQIYFAGSYGDGTQNIYSIQHGIKAEITANNGYLDRPIAIDNETFLVQGYSLDGLDLYRWKKNPSQQNISKPDMHEFLTGQKPFVKKEISVGIPPSVPYSATSTPATSMWPQYWMPEITAATNGTLIGASSGGNDSLEYHKYGAIIQYDTRSKFPTYKVFYENRENPVSFLFSANQTNSYFISTGKSNRNATYSIEASIPFNNTTVTLGGAFQERTLFGSTGQNILLFQNTSYRETSKTPFAISTNRGQELELFTSVYPNSRNEKFFADIRPRAAFYFQGIRPTHSISASALAGITTNRYLASNYYLGGGVSNLSPSAFVVRGYPVDALFGQRIATLNLAYTLPLSHPNHGWKTNPLFLSSYGLRFLADAGTANYIARYSGADFQYYQGQNLAKQNLLGFGLDLVANGSIFYHVPISASLGIHYGALKKYGGEPTLFFGINAGTFGNLSRTDHLQ